MPTSHQDCWTLIRLVGRVHHSILMLVMAPRGDSTNNNCTGPSDLVTGVAYMALAVESETGVPIS